jgi:hypothetical protein
MCEEHMGNRSRRNGKWHGRVRAIKDHAKKQAARKQKRHLKTIKTKQELRAILLGSRHIRGKV